MIKTIEKTRKRTNIRRRIRQRVIGTAERPRLAIFKSLKSIYAQVIDDSHGNTLVAASSGEGGAKGQPRKGGANRDAARSVGELIAERSLAKGIKRVVFDRGGYLYHGNVKALAEAARGKGLEF